MEQVSKRKGAAVGSRTRSIAFVGLSIALMAVSAWVSIPLGPIPFTLQTFVMMFALLVLTPKQCLAAIAGYLLLGAIGVPVFSSMRGGIGILMGPTGGFLWGWLVAAAVVLAIGAALGNRLPRSKPWVMALLFTVLSYSCGWAQYMAVSHLDPLAAFLTGVAPFVLIEAAKLAAAVVCARAVGRAVPNA